MVLTPAIPQPQDYHLFADRIEPALGQRLLWPLVVFGIASVVWWRATGDLRPYGVAQFGPALVLLLTMWFEPKIRALWPVAAFYALAKAAEFFDGSIFSAISLSGHTLKHLAAALSAYWILRWRSAAMLA
jgi:hypothetical protein